MLPLTCIAAYETYIVLHHNVMRCVSRMQPQATRSHSKGVVRGSAGINDGEPQGARATHVIEKVLLAQNHKLLKGAALVQILPGAQKATL
jgi:hypothetical protein